MSTRADDVHPRARWLPWTMAFTPAATLAVVLPKCPVCLAAQLALIGVSATWPTRTRAGCPCASRESAAGRAPRALARGAANEY